MEKGLMSDMDAVEIADGDDRVFKRFVNLIDIVNNFHTSDLVE
jgi:hypothetical protein